MPNHNRRTFLKVSGAALGGMFATSGTVLAQESSERFIVDLKGNKEPKGVDVVHDLSAVGLAVVEGSKSDAGKLGKAAPDVFLKRSPPESGAEPHAGSTVEDETYYNRQWDKQVLDVETAHGVTTGEGTTISIIDSGIDYEHPDLTVDQGASENFTADDGTGDAPFGEYHGTHVAGIAAADDNGTGIIGVAPGADLVSCRVFSPEEEGASFANILAAIVHSVDIGADVANLSLGAYPVPRQGNGKFYGKVLNSTMTYANREGTLLTISAGNDAADLQHDGGVISLPNEGAQALSVSATTSVGYDPETREAENPGYAPASYTNYGTNAITLGAPGGDVPAGGGNPDLVYSAIPVEFAEAIDFPRPYAYLAGTSMAAPNVAGAAALVKSANPTYNANQVESALKRAAEVPDGYDKEYYGAGFLNVVDAL